MKTKTEPYNALLMYQVDPKLSLMEAFLLLKQRKMSQTLKQSQVFGCSRPSLGLFFLTSFSKM